MREEFFELDNKKFRSVYYDSEKNNAIIVLIHGLGEHIGRYKEWASEFNKYNYLVCGFDLIGHGKSDGQRGYIKSLDNFYDSIDYFLEKVSSEHPRKDIILYGHSMGGNIVANYILERNPRIKATILSSPWFSLASKPNIFRVLLAKTMNKIYPKFSDKTGLNVNFISSLDHEVKKYETDKLVHSKITPRLFLSIYSKGKSVIKKSKHLRIPTFVFHGSDDQITNCGISEEFSNNNSEIEFKKYEKGYHELHHDFCREELLNDILDWLSVKVVHT